MLTLYDASGSVILDGSRKVVKTLGTFVVGGQGSARSGTITDGRLTLGRPFFMILKFTGWYNGSAVGSDVEVAIQGNVLTWQFPIADNSQPYMRPSATILYGIY